MNVSMCEVVLYQEHFPTIETVEEICKTHDTIKKYAICLHDQDKNANGAPLKVHYHAILHFGRSVDTANCEKWFNCSGSAVEKIKGRWKDALLYIIHRNAPEKYQYPVESVKSNFDYADELAKAEKAGKQKTMAQDLANSIIRGEKTYRQAFNDLLQYDYNREATRYLRDAYSIYSRNIPAQRDITVVLLFGASASGKTALAQELCKADGVDYCLSGSGSDPLSDYMGESALILDDVREDTFTFTEWLKLLDNHTGSPIRSRYSNKFFTGKYIYLCVSTNPVFWFTGIHEDRWQFFRRIKALIQVTPETVTHYDGFKQQGSNIDYGAALMSYKNPIPLLYPQEKQQDQYASKFCKAMTKIFDQLNETNMKEITSMEEMKK